VAKFTKRATTEMPFGFMTEQRADYDSPWKESLENYFTDFIAFFFPQVDADIDWSRGYEFLDTELQQIVRDAELGRRLADKLVKVWRTSGDETWVLVHIEVQSQEESDFSERMFVYNYRLRDRYNRRVASLAVLSDERLGWRPAQFQSELWGCEISFRFPVVKLLDYRQQWQVLENTDNPFATVVMAHLKAQETRSDQEIRKYWKLYLTRRLYERGYQRQDILNLFRFINWLMALPQELDRSFWQEVQQYQRERQMPYVTSLEQMWLNQGIQQGIEQGIQQERLQGLRSAIELGLELKFGNEGLELLPEISQIEDIEMLQAIKSGIRTVNTLAELRSIYQRDDSSN
jgi:hypothetical protein